jgi:UDP:flavonoid glycosyltransferase YjiC (YdhE family)
LTILQDDRYARNAQLLGHTLRAAGGYRKAAQEVLMHVYAHQGNQLRKIA